MAGARLVSKQALLERSDAVSLHMVLSERTAGASSAPQTSRA